MLIRKKSFVVGGHNKDSIGQFLKLPSYSIHFTYSVPVHDAIIIFIIIIIIIIISSSASSSISGGCGGVVSVVV